MLPRLACLLATRPQKPSLASLLVELNVGHALAVAICVLDNVHSLMKELGLLSACVKHQLSIVELSDDETNVFLTDVLVVVIM